MERRSDILGKWAVANAVVLAALASHVLFQATPSTEAVRLRNALLLEPEPVTAAAADWTPRERPAGFRFETLPPDPRFVAVVKAIGADRGPDLARTLAVAGHLTEKAGGGGAIQADTWTTYQRIRAGDGYCADFIQAFLALAHAAGLTAREWGFSFDGFGGWGHAVVEVYDRQRGSWVFVDVYNNFHVVERDSGEPLDVATWRQVLEGSGQPVSIVLNGPGRFGWSRGESSLWNYYRRGVDGWYLWLGNDVQTYESQPLVSLAGRLSRSLEQLAAIAAGVHPRIQVIGNERNREAFERMRALGQRLRLELAGLVLLSLSLAGIGLAWWRARRAEAQAGGEGGGGKGGGSGREAPRVALVGPLPPPSGGMASQCQQLAGLLQGDGVAVDLVQTNRPCRPAWLEQWRGLRAACRLPSYLWRLWRALSRAQVAHVLANSGWAWHLMAAPAIILARLRGVPVVVHYHGGEAEAFFAQAPGWVRRTLAQADALVVPSGFLEAVFRHLGFRPVTVPNVVDLERFRPRQKPRYFASPHVVVTRNLEPIYDIPTALRAFALVAERFPAARMTVAGSGPEAERLQDLAAQLGIAGQVVFCGRIDHRDIHALYATADVVLNPSTVDNQPVSLLEAFASGVPVVSTDVGGIPYLARDGENALLVSPGDPRAMADAVLALVDDPQFAARLATRGLNTAAGFGWPRVGRLWLDIYERLAAGRRAPSHA